MAETDSSVTAAPCASSVGRVGARTPKRPRRVRRLRPRATAIPRRSTEASAPQGQPRQVALRLCPASGVQGEIVNHEDPARRSSSLRKLARCALPQEWPILYLLNGVRCSVAGRRSQSAVK
jgi:hypothetical protein